MSNTQIAYAEIRWRPEGDEAAWKYQQIPVGKNSFSIQGLARGTTYVVQMRNVGTNGLVSDWAQAIHTIDGESLPPPPPTTMQALGVADGIDVSWSITNRVPAGAEYELFRSTSAGGTYVPVWKGKTVADGADVSTEVTLTPVLNPLFEAGDQHWEKGTGWTIEEDINAMSGTWVAKKSGGGTTAIVNAAKIPVQEGQDISVRAYLKASTTNGSAAAVGVQWLNAAYGVVGTTFGNTVTDATTGTFQISGGVMTAPSGAIFAQALVKFSTYNGGSWYLDNVYGYLSDPPLSDAEKAIIGDVVKGGNWPFDFAMNKDGTETPADGRIGYGSSGTFMAPNGYTLDIPSTAYTKVSTGTDFSGGEGFVMFTGSDLTRFGALTGGNDVKYFVACRFVDNQWYYGNDVVPFSNTFTPNENDVLVAKISGSGTSVVLDTRYASKRYFVKGVDQAGPGDVSPTNQLPLNISMDDYGSVADVLDDWLIYVTGNQNDLSIQSGGAFGGKVLRSTGPMWLLWKWAIPYDPTKLYRFSMQVRQNTNPTGTKFIYGGFVGFAENTTTDVTKSGGTASAVISDHHCGPDGATQTADGLWTQYSFYWKGTAATGENGQSDTSQQAARAHQNVRYFRPMIGLNIGGTGGQVEIDHLVVEQFGVVVGSANIANQAIGQTHLLHAPIENLIPNGYSEAGLAAVGKSPEGDNLVNDPTNARDGKWCRRYQLQSSYTRYVHATIPCIPGNQFYYEFYAKVSNALTVARTMRIILDWRDKDGAGIAGVATNIYTGSATPISTTYQKYSIAGTAPANATTAVFQFEDASAGSDNSKFVFIDAISARRMVTFDLIAVNTLKTPNYAEDGSGNATAGVLIDTNVGGSVLKTASAGIQVGQYNLEDPIFRAFNALVGDRTSTGNADSQKTWYHGGCQTSVRQGTPDIARLKIQPVSQASWSVGGTPSAGGSSHLTTCYFIEYDCRLEPSSYAGGDNLDSMRYMDVTPYKVWGTGGWAEFAESRVFCVVPDRVYANATDSSAGNWTRWRFRIMTTRNALAGSAFSFSGDRIVLRVRLYNSHGNSVEKFFLPANSAFPTGGMIQSDTVDAISADGSSSGGPVGGVCIAPWEHVVMADGKEIMARFVEPGFMVRTYHEIGLRQTDALVAKVQESVSDEGVQMYLRDGRCVTCTAGHRWYSLDRQDFVRADQLKPGERIHGDRPGTVLVVEPFGRMETRNFTVPGPATYQVQGLLCHNTKLP